MNKQTFRKGQLVWDAKGKRQGKFIAYNRDAKTATVEFIIEFNKESGERTTKLENVGVSSLRKYINKSSKFTRKPLEIKVKYFDKEIPKLEKIKVGDWIDLRSAETVELKQGEFKLIPLGIGMKLPYGFEANIVPRSSTFKNFGILQTNSMGVIDNSYSGNNDQYFFPALAMRDTKIEKGDRICQFRVNRTMPNVEFIEVSELDEVSRSGFGSTGVK